MVTLRRCSLLAVALVISGWLAAAPPSAMAATNAEARTLPQPAGLEPAIRFWTRIYTETPVDRGVIHDSADSLRIFGEVSVAPPGQWSERRRQVRRVLDEYRDALRDLAAGSMEARTPLQAHLLQQLPAGVTVDEALALADRLRFQGGLREHFRDGLVRSGRWRGYIAEALAEAGLPAELIALPHVESSFNPIARSHAGAAGLWQFTAGTGREFMRVDPVVDERLDPWLSTRAAAALLQRNYAMLGTWPLAITAYNHGANGMRRAVNTVGSTDYMRIRESYRGPRFGFASRNFYPSLLAAAHVDARRDHYFPGLVMDSPGEFIRVQLPHYTPLDTLTDGLGLSAGDMLALNPALGPAVSDGRKFVPRGYPLVLPGASGGLAERVQTLPGSRLFTQQRPALHHAVRPGETLSGIAARYGVGLRALMAGNGITDPNRIRVGTTLSLPTAGAMPEPVSGGYHQVRSGETLSGIARRHGLSADRLQRINDLSNPDRIRVGQRLRLTADPAGSIEIGAET